MVTRREIVVGGALVLVFGIGVPLRSQPRLARVLRTYGCTLHDDDLDQYERTASDNVLFLTGNEPMIRGSGDRDFDLALAHTLARIADVFQALPGFAFYDDYDGNNAYATPRPRLQRADGTVLFGQRLLAQLRARTEHPEIGVVSVCAHEFGHILQYKKGLDTLVGANQPTVKRIELQADFFAGFFAGMRKLERSDFPAAVFALMQFNAGDNMRNAKNHHGTDQERGAAVVRGFQAAFNERRSLSEAIQISINYVTQL